MPREQGSAPPRHGTLPPPPAASLSWEPLSRSAHHLQGLAQYEAVQTQHVWVLQVHHDGHLSKEVPQLCAHGAFRTHPEGFDSHWDLGSGGKGHSLAPRAERACRTEGQ